MATERNQCELETLQHHATNKILLMGLLEYRIQGWDVNSAVFVWCQEFTSKT